MRLGEKDFVALIVGSQVGTDVLLADLFTRIHRSSVSIAGGQPMPTVSSAPAYR